MLLPRQIERLRHLVECLLGPFERPRPRLFQVGVGFQFRSAPTDGKHSGVVGGVGDNLGDGIHPSLLGNGGEIDHHLGLLGHGDNYLKIQVYFHVCILRCKIDALPPGTLAGAAADWSTVTDCTLVLVRLLPVVALRLLIYPSMSLWAKPQVGFPMGAVVGPLNSRIAMVCPAAPLAGLGKLLANLRRRYRRGSGATRAAAPCHASIVQTENVFHHIGYGVRQVDGSLAPSISFSSRLVNPQLHRKSIG